MNSIDLISMGLKSLFRRKARTILTILGVVVGAASIIIMLSLGIGMNKSFEEQLKSFGSLNTIDVRSKSGMYYDESEKDISNGKIGKLDDASIKIIESIEGVDTVMPMKEEYFQIYSGKYSSSINLVGIDSSKLDKFDFIVGEGRTINPEGKYEILFGSTISKNFYNPRSRNRYSNSIEVDLLNSKLSLIINNDYSNNKKPKGITVKGVGILKESNSEKDWNAYIDIKQLEKLKIEAKRKSKNKERRKKNTQDKYSQFKVKVNDVKKVGDIQTKIKKLGFQAYSLADGLDYMKKATAGLRATLGGIGAVSLFVAAIGITNTMVMSIYERTKEIGVMKVIGAEIRDIKRLFLFEAGMIGFFGGLIGVILSYLISYALNSIGISLLGFGMGNENASLSIIPPWLAVSSVFFSTIVGILAGYYPANRAMKLSALEAIRSE